MWEIWANELLPPALNGCPKCKKSPNLVTLQLTKFTDSPSEAITDALG